MNRYGMKARSIRYWQNEGRSITAMVGWAALRQSFRYTLDSRDQFHSRQIGHEIIRLAAVTDPSIIRAMITGRYRG